MVFLLLVLLCLALCPAILMWRENARDIDAYRKYQQAQDSRRAERTPAEIEVDARIGATLLCGDPYPLGITEGAQ